MEAKGVKVTVVGVGTVGAAVAFALTAGGLATELALIDADRRRAEGQAMDLADAAAFVKPVDVYAADYPDAAGSQVVIFSAGVPRAPGQSRLELAQKNLAVARDAFPRILRYCPEAVVVVVTNPVDIITYACCRLADMADEKILGTGTVLDTSRLKSILARHVKVDPRNVHAYIVGEHGDSEVALWSRVSVAGYGLDEYCRHRDLPLPDRAKIVDQVIRTGAEIIARKGATQFAVSITVSRIVEAIVRDERSVLTVSGLVEGIYGLEGPNCLSLPCLVDSGGRRRPLPMTLDPAELTLLRESAARLKAIHREVGLA